MNVVGSWRLLVKIIVSLGSKLGHVNRDVKLKN